MFLPYSFIFCRFSFVEILTFFLGLVFNFLYSFLVLSLASFNPTFSYLPVFNLWTRVLFMISSFELKSKLKAQFLWSLLVSTASGGMRSVHSGIGLTCLDGLFFALAFLDLGGLLGIYCWWCTIGASSVPSSQDLSCSSARLFSSSNISFVGL